ncbi:MAG: octaprenyl diphosphate synthase, partial [Halothiobacillaceae bacterium]
AAVIRQAIKQGGVENLPVVLEAIANAGSLTYTARLAMNEAEQAIASLAILPPTPHREALETIARFAAARDH